MRALRQLLGMRRRDQRGLEGLEWLLIAAVVIIAVVASWKALSSTTPSQFTKINPDAPNTANDALTSGENK